MEINKKMAQRLLEIRKAKGLTQAEFSEAVKMDRSTITGLENGLAPLTEKNISLICLTFSVREEWLRHGIGDMLDEEALYTEEEKRLLALFEKLSPRARDMLVKYAEKIVADEAALRGDAGEKGVSG